MASEHIKDVSGEQSLSHTKKIGLFLGPVLFLLIQLLPSGPAFTASARCAAGVVVWTAVWWITEAIPIAMTSLLPAALFVLLGTMSIERTALAFMNRSLFLFMGGMFISMAMQKWDLHKRIALTMVVLVGTSPSRLVLGFLLATGFISLWINNTSAAVMLFPIGMALIGHFKERAGAGFPLKDFAFALMLAIAYGANIGGIGTKIGTAPNVMYAGSAKDYGITVDFMTWLKIGLPVVLVLLPLAWFCLVRVSTRLYRVRSEEGREIVRSELRAMGSMSRGEKIVLAVFVAAVLLWLVQDLLEPLIQKAWLSLGIMTSVTGKTELLSDEVIALLAALALFIIPVRWKEGEYALDWKWAGRIPWDVLLLLGGGFVLSEGFKQSGLSTWLAGQFHHVSGIGLFGLILVGTSLSLGLSAVASNTATVAIMLPVLAEVARGVGINPVYLMLPATIAASCDFMLPAGTPPNAIVFGSGYVTIPRMARTGLLMDLLSILVVTVLCYFLIPLVYGLR